MAMNRCAYQQVEVFQNFLPVELFLGEEAYIMQPAVAPSLLFFVSSPDWGARETVATLFPLSPQGSGAAGKDSACFPQTEVWGLDGEQALFLLLLLASSREEGAAGQNLQPIPQAGHCLIWGRDRRWYWLLLSPPRPVQEQREASRQSSSPLLLSPPFPPSSSD